MITFIKNFIRKILISPAWRSDSVKNNQPGLSALSDDKLIATIGLEHHYFYYPTEKNKTRNPDFLEKLLKEAEGRNLSDSNIVKGARSFIDKFKDIKLAFNETNVQNFNGSFFELARARQSIRKFSKKNISIEDMREILRCAIEAPSSCNRQAYRFLILEDKKSLEFIARIRRIPFLSQANKVICVFADLDIYSYKIEHDYTIYMDGSAAIMNILYAAQEFGIASCWINFGKLEVNDEKLKEFFEFFRLKENLRPISLIALGYRDQNVPKPARESIDYYLVKN